MRGWLKWKLLLLGAATFTAAHAVEVWKWQAWFGGAQHAPWFLNGDGRAVLFVAACVFVSTFVSGFLSARSKSEAVLQGISVAAGAVAAMIVILLRLPGGPGNLFPIVIAAAAVILVGAAFAATAMVTVTKGS
jgi:hypothetical protein